MNERKVSILEAIRWAKVREVAPCWPKLGDGSESEAEQWFTDGSYIRVQSEWVWYSDESGGSSEAPTFYIGEPE